MHLDFLNDLLFQYGLYAVFILVMLEGDITLLLAGVLAHSAFFGPYSFAQVLIWGTLGGCLSDNLAYFAGRGFCEGVRQFRFYRAAQSEEGFGLGLAIVDAGIKVLGGDLEIASSVGYGTTVTITLPVGATRVGR